MSSVRVVLRIRPLSNPNTSAALSIPPNQQPFPRVIQTATNSQYTFDYVASPSVTQQQLFESIGSPVIDSCLDGFNGTIFCYGQTGSGKTYTMTGPEDSSESERGMIPRILESLFDKIDIQQTENPSLEFYCSCSFLEIYNEQIVDLLGEPNKHLQLREDISNGVYVEGLNHEQVGLPEDALQLLHRGLEQRHTGETKANAKSSRSHSVFTVHIQSKEIGEVTTTKTARLNLIDLAGSERQSHTSAEGMRLTEACNINKSLSTLGQVILALSERQKGRSMHVHYRDSKLTFLLRDSLGGNSKTCIVSNVSADPKDLSETVSTLKFAQRAKRIRNKPIANENVTGNIALLQEQLKRLRHQLIEANEKLAHQPRQNTAMDLTHDQEQIVAGQQMMLDDISEIASEQSYPFRTQPKEGETVENFTMYLKNVALAGCSYNRRLRRALRRNYDTMDILIKLLDSTERLFLACRFALKSREWELAKAQGRQPQLDLFHRGKNGVFSIEMDPIDADLLQSDDEEQDEMMLDEDQLNQIMDENHTDNDLNDSYTLDIEYTQYDDDDPLLDLDDDEDQSYSHNQLTHAEKILAELYHPENHPMVLRQMYETLEWKNRYFDMEESEHDTEYYEGLKQAITYCERKLKQYFMELKKKKDEMRLTEQRMEAVHKLKESFQKKNEEIKEIWNQKMEWENRYKVLQEKLRRQQVLIDEQTTKMKDLQERLAQKTMQEEEGKILQNASAVAETEHYLETLQGENQTLLQIVEKLESDKEVLTNQFKSEFEAETQRLNLLVEQKASDLRSMHQQFNAQYTELQNQTQNQIQQLKNELQSKSEENNKLRGQVHELQMGHDQSENKRMQEHYESQISSYQDQLQQMQTKLAAAQSQAEASQKRFEHQLQEQYASQVDSLKIEMQTKMSQAQEEIHFLKEENAKMQNLLSHNKSQEEDLMLHANNAMSEKMAELNFELRQLREEKHKVEEELRRRNAQDSSVHEQLQRHKTEIQGLKKQLMNNASQKIALAEGKENASPNEMMELY
eukprot:CAMPEP_0117451956 /NCGR_PEP_ID=MMETSP0759-20121206/9309_1 /TAXON_ID=63605 /ORGANISM="Percolomonas cosmopolitus, Strain WS" /LENGTH=1026 /DNA_ID=CAMNT_0005244641 /DNA_START=33 /DNA_END=3113 /DNA_ORIENTATION=-